MSRDPVQDLHHEKPVDSGHIRLISEGGSSPLHSSRPTCIDSIQVSQTCTTESHHATYRAATGACAIFYPCDNSLFSIPAEHAPELDQGILPAVLLTRFAQQGLSLSDGASLEIHRPGRIWYISDAGTRFSIRKLLAHLTVYRDTQ